MLDGLGGKLERYMDLLAYRQRLVGANIANAETPGYRTRDIDFAAELREAGSPQTVEVGGLKVRNDGNNVSLDREARLLSENALRFQMASNLVRVQMRVMRSAIQEGKAG